jgi:hypothetical protein
MKSIVVFIAILILSGSCGEKSASLSVEDNQEIVTSSQPRSNANDPEFTLITVEYPNVGWGYQILQDGKLAIDQKHIPVIQGYKSFSSKEKAEKTGNFIIQKMKNGVFPPTLTEQELDSLEVL